MNQISFATPVAASLGWLKGTEILPTTHIFNIVENVYNK